MGTKELAAALEQIGAAGADDKAWRKALAVVAEAIASLFGVPP